MSQFLILPSNQMCEGNKRKSSDLCDKKAKLYNHKAVKYFCGAHEAGYKRTETAYANNRLQKTKEEIRREKLIEKGIALEKVTSSM